MAKVEANMNENLMTLGYQFPNGYVVTDTQELPELIAFANITNGENITGAFVSVNSDPNDYEILVFTESNMPHSLSARYHDKEWF